MQISSQVQCPITYAAIEAAEVGGVPTLLRRLPTGLLSEIERDEDMYGPFDSVADLMAALNA